MQPAERLRPRPELARSQEAGDQPQLRRLTEQERDVIAGMVATRLEDAKSGGGEGHDAVEGDEEHGGHGAVYGHRRH